MLANLAGFGFGVKVTTAVFGRGGQSGRTQDQIYYCACICALGGFPRTDYVIIWGVFPTQNGGASRRDDRKLTQSSCSFRMWSDGLRPKVTSELLPYPLYLFFFPHSNMTRTERAAYPRAINKDRWVIGVCFISVVVANKVGYGTALNPVMEWTSP
ncbi:hypothetical protein AG1IA_09715 [Rhizoctonia solani AG-1 IA]|uniref:Uncharacterized protein n=1 Tax=Thanatephorus cucumeris (strain AG1-IA) TaxID=983506 RepID=L8WE95_THACA|nr:hypothetical protein AG1IA_09715 [Rhizoctonia solani AG-1 IA]